MKRGPKVLSLFIVLTLMAGLFAACGSSGNQGNPEATTSKTAGDSSSAKALEPVKLKILTGGDQPEQPDAPMVADEIEKQTKDGINVQIEVQTYAWGDYINRVKTMAAAGDPFDIYLSFQGELRGNIDRKQCISLNDLIDKYGEDIKKVTPEDLWGDMTINGNIYGVPSNYPFVGDLAILVRGDLREKYGIPEIKDMATFEKYLDAVTKNEKGMVGLTAKEGRQIYQMNLAMTGGKWQQLYGQNILGNDFVNIAYVDSSKKPYKIENFFTSDIAKQMIDWNRKAYKNGWIAKDVLTIKDENTLFASGKSAALGNDLWTIGSLAPVMEKNIPGCKVEAVTFFDYGNAQRFTKDNNFAQISGTSKNPERAMMFLNWIRQSKDNYDLYMYGIKGKHWEPVGDDKFKLPEGVDAANRTYNPTPWWTRTMQYDRVDENANAEFLKMFQNALNCKYTTPDIISYSFDSSPVKTQWAQLQTVVLEKWLPVFWGIKDSDVDYNEAVEALNKAGQEQVLTEMQKQLDEWAKNNK